MSFAATTMLYFLLFTFIYLLFKLFLHPKQNTINHKKPPGPPTLPIIGNLHMLGKLPHRTLQSLSKRYGPIMSLQLGQVPTIVISSSKGAESFLKTHDIVFASRPKIQGSELMSYGSKGLPFSEYGPYWRSMRKFCTLKLLSASKVEKSGPIRKEELGVLVNTLKKASLVGEVVNVSEIVENLIEDIVYKMILGRGKYEQFDLKKMIKDGLTLMGAFNLADYVPWLGIFDLQGLTQACKKTSKALDEVLEMIITEHEQTTNTDDPKDFVDTVLSIMHQTIDVEGGQDLVIDRTIIKAILLDMIGASIDTSSNVIEWALSELLRHPRVMKILQDEIQNEVGNKRMVEEKDLKNFNYLDMVVDETLRLYPVAPLLIPRECRENITIDDYSIKEKTRVIVNAWAIGRDPDVWSENAEEFYPERFIEKKMNYLGQEFESIPFGSGRRRCPGIQLGMITVKLVIAQFVHCFNWELPHNISPSNLNMEEKFGLTIPRAQHLHAIPSYRLDDAKLE
ncbi:putative costunolide synthase [Medicago truncatula]|uniref:Cytochrome P450 family 71 protein n=1 Tax=Medicago truncatula TaxID=3880 RepID=G7KE81_MEDTR|nr:cytochrome P450 CYP736A12 [Medicago truncatula]AES98625.2 cytochrome P450 family 71 protein [Medicago truncatula]RHN56496.1 putative costunolide synthase [Medicago truncatula]